MRPALAQAALELSREVILTCLAFAPVELGVAAGGAQGKLEVLRAQGETEPRPEMLLLEAIAVGIEAEALPILRREAVVGFGAGAQTQPRLLIAKTQAGSDDAAAIAAGAQRRGGLQALAGGDQKHAADRIRAIVAGARAAQVFDPPRSLPARAAPRRSRRC